jgi:REP element-mobilizing transposase RayT
MNRGLARRALFESPREYRHFLALLACAVRKGWIEVHAYCLMDNHFHLLVRSRNGDMSATMQWIQDAYVRWFNLRHGRDGPLVRGRFAGKILSSLTSRRAVLGYIHDNPVAARMVGLATSHPWSSARHHIAMRGRPWLSRQFARSLDPDVRDGRSLPTDLIESWLADPAPDLPELDLLVSRRPAHVRGWLVANALRADGVLPPRVLVRVATLEAALQAARTGDPGWRIQSSRRSLPGWEVLQAGLLRAVCALPLARIASLSGVATSTVHRQVRIHRLMLQGDAAYATRAGEIVHACLHRDYGTWLQRRA